MINILRKYFVILLLILYWIGFLVLGLYLYTFKLNTFISLNIVSYFLLFFVLFLVFIGELFVKKLKVTEEILKNNQVIKDLYHNYVMKSSEDYYRNVRIHLILGNIVYYGVVLLLVATSGLLLLCFNRISFFFFLVVAFILYFAIIPLIKYDKKEKITGYLINKDKHPLIYEYLEEVKNLKGINEDIKIVLIEDSNIYIKKISNKYYLHIGAEALTILTKEELCSIIEHELAHILNKDIEKLDKLYAYLKKWNNVSNTDKYLATALIYAPISYFLLRDYYLFTSYMGVESEKHADEMVVDKLNFAKALSKLEINDLIMSDKKLLKEYENLMDINEDNYLNYYHYHLEAINKIYSSNSSEINNLIRLPLKNVKDAHPLLKERLKALNVGMFKLSFNEQTNYNLDEVIKIMLTNSNVLEIFENNKLSKEEVSKLETKYLLNNDLLSLAKLYFCDYLDYEKSLKIINKIIDESSYYNKEALFLKGKALLELKDKSGISYLEDVMRREPLLYLKEGYEYLENYFIKYGYKDEYQKLVNKNEEYQKALEELAKVTINNEKKYISIISIDNLKIIKNILNDYEVKKVYVYDQYMDYNNLRSVIIIDTSSDINEIKSKIYNSINECNIYIEKYQKKYRKYLLKEFEV